MGLLQEKWRFSTNVLVPQYDDRMQLRLKVGLLEFDLVTALFGKATVLTRLIYSIQGITG